MTHIGVEDIYKIAGEVVDIQHPETGHRTTLILLQMVLSIITSMEEKQKRDMVTILQFAKEISSDRK